ncbi:MAG: helix-turn-helix domain-containing protein [Planctomycetes bacterium]|nr:helix-turn-helix domain-containing protein [Planctomycetota bacterium]
MNATARNQDHNGTHPSGTLHTTLEEIRSRLSQVEEDLDGVIWTLAGQHSASRTPEESHVRPPESRAGPLPTGTPSSVGSDPNFTITRGVTMPESKPDGDPDASRFVIAGRVVDLPHLPAALLRILLVDDPSAPGPFLPWKKYEDIAAVLEGMTSRSYKRRGTITQLVWRLRKLFEKAGLPRTLIQTRRGRGVRFFLRRGGATDAADSQAE